MRNPGRRRASVVAALTLLAGLNACASEDPGPPRQWRVIAGDAQGVIVAEGATTRGYPRKAGSPSWETAGELNGIACVTDCSSAYLTFSDRPGIWFANRGTVVRAELEAPPGTVRVLMASRSSAVVLHGPSQHQRLLLVRNDGVKHLRGLPAGSPLWFGTPGRGTLIMLGESDVTAVEVELSDSQARTTRGPSTSTEFLCLDGDLSPRSTPSAAAVRTLERALTHISSCRTGPGASWVGVSTFLTMGPDNPSGRTATAVAVSDDSGRMSWSDTYVGEGVDLSPDTGEHLLVPGESGMAVVETTTGTPVHELSGVIDGNFVDARALVTIDGAGTVRWVDF